MILVGFSNRKITICVFVFFSKHRRIGCSDGYLLAFAVRPAAGSTTGLSSPWVAKEKSKSFRVSLCRPLPIGREVYRAIPKFQEKLILVDIISCLFICFASKWTYHPAKKPSTCWILGPTLIGKRFTWNLSLKTWTSIQWFSFQVQDPFFLVFIFPSRSTWTSGTFHKRLCWSTMKGGTWVSLLHCCKLQWAQYDVAGAMFATDDLFNCYKRDKTSRWTRGDRWMETWFCWIGCWKLLVIVLWPNDSPKMDPADAQEQDAEVQKLFGIKGGVGCRFLQILSRRSCKRPWSRCCFT